MLTSVLCASRFPCQLPSAVTLPAPATNPVCRRTSLSAVSKSYRGRISATERTAPRPPLLKQILVGFLALLLIVQAAGANVLQPEKAKACCQCEADVNEMLSSMYGWIWGSDSQYCKKDFPDVGAASLLAEPWPRCQAQPADACNWQVWAGFVDSFTDTLKARGAAVTPAQTQVGLSAFLGSHSHLTSMPLLDTANWKKCMAVKQQRVQLAGTAHSPACCMQSVACKACHT